MSSFDRRVCQWLNTASIPDKSKATLLNRMNVGISNYRHIHVEPTPGLNKTRPSMKVDYGLQDHISKAQRRLQNGDSGTVENPLFPLPAVYADRSNSAPVTPRGGSPRGTSTQRMASPSNDLDKSNQEQQQQQPGSVAFSTFTFGEQCPTGMARDNSHLSEEEHDHHDDHELTDKEDLQRRLTLKRQSRHAISAEIIALEETKKFDAMTIPKSPEITATVQRALETHYLFSHLDDVDLNRVINIMKIKHVKKGEKLVSKDVPNNTFFVVVTGACVNSGTKEKLTAGSCFGDLGLLYESQSTETIASAVDFTQCCTIDRETYKKICSKASMEKRAMYEEFLSGVKFLQGLNRHERLQLADALKSAKYKKGEKLIKYGSEGIWFSIIVQGKVNVIGRDKDGKECFVCEFSEGDCVGELEFLFKHRTVADVVAASDIVRTAKMTSRHFEKVIGSAKEVLERQANNSEVYQYYREARKNVFGSAENMP